MADMIDLTRLHSEEEYLAYADLRNTIPNEDKRYIGIDVETMYLLHNMKELKYPIIKDIIRKGCYI